MSELEEFRKMKDEFFRDHFQSPLTPEQRNGFSGLKYYPDNPALRLELPLERYATRELVKMQTSTGDVQDYLKIGQIRFEVDGQQAMLQVYEAEDNPGSYFIPFVDATAPEETYGAGRYLEPEEFTDDRLLLDFNLAYNPYCAYNESWSCPYPPAENRLKVRIEAGEKKYHPD